MTRINRLFFGCTLLLLPLVLLCSKSDVVTGAGTGVISDYDSTLTDMDVFRSAVLDSLDIDSAFSLPTSPDPVFSTHHNTTVILIGSDSTQFVASHLSFKPEAISKRLKGKDSVISAFMYFQEADEADTFSMNVMKSAYLGDSVAVPLNDEVIAGTSNLRAGLIDSIKLDSATTGTIFRMRTDSLFENSVNFSIVDSAVSLKRLFIPYIIMMAKDSTGDTLKDTIIAKTRFTVYEKEAAVESLSKLPISSQLSKRTAVYKVDPRKLYLAMHAYAEDAFSEVLNAVYTGDFINGHAVDISYSTSCKILISNELETDPFKLAQMFNNLPLRDLSVKEGAGTITSRERTQLQKIMRDVQKPIYIYHRIYSANSLRRDALWLKPELKAVFTTSR